MVSLNCSSGGWEGEEREHLGEERRRRERHRLSGNQTVSCKPLAGKSFTQDYRVVDVSGSGLALEPSKIKLFGQSTLDRTVGFAPGDLILIQYCAGGRKVALEFYGEVRYLRSSLGQGTRMGIALADPLAAWNDLLEQWKTSPLGIGESA